MLHTMLQWLHVLTTTQHAVLHRYTVYTWYMPYKAIHMVYVWCVQLVCLHVYTWCYNMLHNALHMVAQHVA
jgi:hypothetical protein